MKIDISEWHRNNPKHRDWKDVFEWLDENIGKSEWVKPSDRGGSVVAEHWRSYKTSTSIEGLFEDTYWLEIDRDVDATAFLLRWA